jgi:hypothetical protein
MAVLNRAVADYWIDKFHEHLLRVALRSRREHLQPRGHTSRWRQSQPHGRMIPRNNAHHLTAHVPRPAHGRRSFFILFYLTYEEAWKHALQSECKPVAWACWVEGENRMMWTHEKLGKSGSGGLLYRYRRCSANVILTSFFRRLTITNNFFHNILFSSPHYHPMSTGKIIPIQALQ